jgi:hypothetical protein
VKKEKKEKKEIFPKPGPTDQLGSNQTNKYKKLGKKNKSKRA